MDGGVVAEYDSVPTLMGRSNSSFRAMVLESDAGTPGTSRASSTQNLAALDGDQNRPLPKGMNTFVNRMKDYGAK